MTTPSTAFQFCAGGLEPKLEMIPSGFRTFHFDGTEYQTEVVRLSDLKFPSEAES